MIPEPDWKDIVKELRKGTAVVLGATDAGKTTLVKYLLKEFLHKNIKVSLVDSDIGQSSLGLPGTISMKVFNSPRDMDDFKADYMFFIGSLNPSEHIPRMIEGTKAMVEKSKSKGADIVIVDTTGLIAGGLGKELKIGKIRAIKPDVVIALQRGEELEHILSLVEDAVIYLVDVSRFARERNRKQRIEYRNKKFAEYFKDSQIIGLSIKELDFFYRGRRFDVKTTGIEPDVLLGINRGDSTVALGIFQRFKDDKIVIKTPLKSLSGITGIMIGSFTVENQVTVNKPSG